MNANSAVLQTPPKQHHAMPVTLPTIALALALAPLGSCGGIDQVKSAPAAATESPAEEALVSYLGTRILPGTATDITVGLGEGTIYKTAGGTPDSYGNYPIYSGDLNSRPFTWTQIPGAAVRLAKGPGFLYVIQANGNFFRWNGSSWQGLLSTYTHDVAVGRNGRVWILWGNPDSYGNYGIYYSDNALHWTSIPGAVTRISVSDDGSLWGVHKADGDVFRWNGSWQWITAFGASSTDPDIGASGSWPNNYVAVVMSGRVHESFNSGRTWDENIDCRPMTDPRTTGRNVTAGFYSHGTGFFAVDSDQRVYGYDFCVGTL